MLARTRSMAPGKRQAATTRSPGEASDSAAFDPVGLNAAVTVVLIGDVRFVKRSRRYRNSNYWRRDFCIKHLDQNERLDDFGSRTRPQ